MLQENASAMLYRVAIVEYVVDLAQSKAFIQQVSIVEQVGLQK